MPKDVDIIPGQAFHLPAAQQKNLTTLLEVFSKKEATEAIKAIGKTDKNTWKDINASIIGLNDFVSAGGIKGMMESLKKTSDLQIADALAPFKNEINQFLTTSLQPIQGLIVDITNELGTFITENKAGATAGGIAGSVISYFLPGGPVWVTLGSVVGALIQYWLSIYLDLPGKPPPSTTTIYTAQELWDFTTKYNLTGPELKRLISENATIGEVLAARIITGVRSGGTLPLEQRF